MSDIKDVIGEMFDKMSDEQKEKALKCETTDEFLVLAGEEGIPLSDELLENTVGGVYMQVGADEGPVITGISGTDLSDIFKGKQATFGKNLYNTKPFGK